MSGPWCQHDTVARANHLGGLPPFCDAGTSIGRGGFLGSVGMVFHAQLRHRWRSWLAITILISLVGGVVMAAAIAGRRTDAAIPKFVSAHGFDAEVYSIPPAPAIARLPGVTSATAVIGPDNGPPKCACTHPNDLSNFGVAVLKGGGSAPFNLVSGRLPEPSNPHEVMASYTLQHDEGVQLGSIISVPVLQSVASVGRERCHRVSASARKPDGGLRGGRVQLRRRSSTFPANQRPPITSCGPPPHSRARFFPGSGPVTSTSCVSGMAQPISLASMPLRVRWARARSSCRTRTPRLHRSRRRCTPRRSAGG